MRKSLLITATGLAFLALANVPSAAEARPGDEIGNPIVNNPAPTYNSADSSNYHMDAQGNILSADNQVVAHYVPTTGQFYTPQGHLVTTNSDNYALYKAVVNQQSSTAAKPESYTVTSTNGIMNSKGELKAYVDASTGQLIDAATGKPMATNNPNYGTYHAALAQKQAYEALLPASGTLGELGKTYSFDPKTGSILDPNGSLIGHYNPSNNTFTDAHGFPITNRDQQKLMADITGRANALQNKVDSALNSEIRDLENGIGIDAAGKIYKDGIMIAQNTADGLKDQAGNLITGALGDQLSGLLQKGLGLFGSKHSSSSTFRSPTYSASNDISNVYAATNNKNLHDEIAKELNLKTIKPGPVPSSKTSTASSTTVTASNTSPSSSTSSSTRSSSSDDVYRPKVFDARD